MDISNMVLTPDLINRGYTVDESPRDNQVSLKCRGEYVKTWCSVDETVKPKFICGVAFQHYLINNGHRDDCALTIQAGGLLI